MPDQSRVSMHDEVERAVRVLAAPGGVIEVRAIAEDGMHSGYFDDPVLVANAAVLLDLSSVQGVYITLNEVNPALLARRSNRIKMRLGRKDATTADSDIVRRRWLPVDIDAVRPSGVSSTQEEHERAIAKAGVIADWLKEFGFSAPVRGDSGNGAHLLYRVVLPNDDESRQLVQQCLAVLGAFFSDGCCTVDTAVFNAGRIWKLYGTVSRKGDSTAERPHRRSHLLDTPEEIKVVPKEVLARLAGMIPVDGQGCGPGCHTMDHDSTAGSAIKQGRYGRESSAGTRTAGGPYTPDSRTGSNQSASGPKKSPAGSSPSDRTKIYREPMVPINLASWLHEHGIRVRSEKPWQNGTIFTLEECPFSTAHADGAFAIQFGNGAVYAGCHHASCGGGTQRWQELRGMYEKEFRERTEQTPERDPDDPSIKSGATTGKSRENKGDEQHNPGTPASPGSSQDEEDAAAKEKALEILLHGDPEKFILDTFASLHVGDETVAACYLVSALSSSVKNSRGLHVCPTGDSGKGKSDSANAFLKLLPASSRMQGSITSKALFYHTLSPGTVIIFDDFGMNEDLREVLKNATSDFQKSLCHFTLNANRQPVTLYLPPRCAWWILSVDNPGDDQVLNRMMNPWIDDSEQQDRRVRDRIFAQARISGTESSENADVATCQAIFSKIREQLFRVCIPFAHRIRMDSIRNRRNPIMFLDIIRAYAALQFMQREQRILPDGVIEIDAAEQDFHTAAKLFTALDSTYGGQTSKLLKNEKMLLDSVISARKNEFTIKDAQLWMGLSHTSIRRILYGREDRFGEPGGLLAKCPALSVIETTVSEGTLESVIRRRGNHYLFDLGQYRRWTRSNGVWLSPDDAAGDDPDEPMGSGWVQIGDSNGDSSDPLENVPMSDQGNNNDNNCTESTPSSPIQESTPHNVSALLKSESSDLRNISACDPGEQGTLAGIIPNIGDNLKIPSVHENNLNPIETPTSSHVGSGDQIRESDYIALPYQSEQPCHVCGKSPTSSVRGDSPRYLCYQCLKSARKKGKISREGTGTSPLTGVLHHQDFTRAAASLGRCTICAEKEAMYQSVAMKTNCCEDCFGRLVREGNEG